MKKKLETEINSGFLLIDKPEGPTSHDMVSMARKILGIRKIGHAGTLDPFASGLIILCLGSATRVSEHLMKRDKRYKFTLMLGAKTDSYDKTGKIILDKKGEKRDLGLIKEENIQKVLKEFTGEIKQTPPLFSALKVRGRKLYEYARKGEFVETKSRMVTVFDLLLLDYRYPRITLEARVSSGTYIRSLGNDIGERLGTGAYVESLRRIAIGCLKASKAISLDKTMEGRKKALRHVISIKEMFPEWLKLKVTQEMEEQLRNGKSILCKEKFEREDLNGSIVIILDGFEKEVCKAVLKREEKGWFLIPKRMF